MHVRLARPSDAEAIRSIYNAEVTGSTATFDLVPRTAEEQVAWLAEHRGPYPAVVAVDDHGSTLGFGSLSEYKNRPAYATTVENSVYIAPEHRVRGSGGPSSSTSSVWPPSTGSTRSSPGSVATTWPPSASMRPAASPWSGGARSGRKFNRWLDVTVLQRLL